MSARSALDRDEVLRCHGSCHYAAPQLERP